MSTNETQKIQIKGRLTKMTVPIDKLSSLIFGYTEDEYKDIVLNHADCSCIEGEDRNGNRVETPYWLEVAEEYANTKPLTPFHREVLFAAISAYEEGYRVLTFRTTLNTLTGGTVKDHISKDQYDAISEAFRKLSFTRIVVDLEPLLNAYPKYKKRYKGKWKIDGMLLPCRFLESEINGQQALAVELLAECPLTIVAKLKRQMMTYDLSPLAIIEQHNTENVIVIKNYLLRRIKLMKSAERKKGLNSSILFETIYKECGFAKATSGEKRDIREVIIDTLNHFKNSKVIKSFEIERQGRIYRSIIISL